MNKNEVKQIRCRGLFSRRFLTQAVDCTINLSVIIPLSRFFFITAPTKEFPAMLVMMSMNVTVVIATSADSGVAEDEKM